MSDKEQKEQRNRPSLTRRGFVAGALATAGALTAAAALSASTLSGCAASKEDQFEDLVSNGVKDEDIETLKVAAEQVIEASSYDTVSFADYLELQATYELPLGSLVYQMDSSFALVLFPGEEGESLRKIGVFDLGSGQMTPVIERPVSTSRSAVIYDARASRTALIWVELDVGSHQWRVYIAPLTGVVAGTPRMIEEGDADFEPPMLAIADNKAYWTVMPVATGAANQENSLLRALDLEQKGAFDEDGAAGQSGTSGQSGAAGQGETAEQGETAGQGAPYTVLASHGRMITNPLVTDGIVTVVPRVDTNNIYYQLTALNCSNDKPVEFQVLPQSLRITDAVYMNGRFAFTIENNYNYAGGLAYAGTYQALDNGDYLRTSKPSLCPVVRFKDCLIIESTANIVGIDSVAKKAFVVDAPPQSPKFGESLIGWGLQDSVVTSSIRLSEDTGIMEATMIRIDA